MMLNKKSSRMSAWKALYVLPLVGISLAATAETKVDYQYEGQQPEAVVDTPVGKDSKKSFKEKNIQEGHFIIDEEAGSITMVYFDHNGNEMRAQYKEMPLRSGDYYFHNGNMCTPGVLEECTKEEDAVLLSAYRSNGSKVRGVVTPNNNYATGVWDTSKPFDEQETVYHMDGKQYNARGGKYVEVQETQINKEKKEPIPFHKVAQTPTFNGGDANEFSKWVSANLKYPEEARQSKAQGRVTVQFTVTETGKVADVKVLRGVNEILDKAAVRIVSESPQWAPGKDENGEIVPVSYVFPVIFKLPDQTSDLLIVVNGERMPAGYDLNTIAQETITSMEVLKTEDALKEYGTNNGVIKITVDSSKKGQGLPKHNIYIDGKKATSEEVAALPPNPKGHIAEDGSVWITTKEGFDNKALTLELNN